MDKLFAKIDLGFFESPKLMLLSKNARHDLIHMICYARNHLTDGFIDNRVAIAKQWLESIEELTTNDDKPSLIVVAGGWKIHDFEKHQTTVAEINELRSKRSKAGRIGAERRWQNGKTEAKTWQTMAKDKDKDKDKDSSGRARTLPDDWKPSEAASEFARANGLDVNHEATQFRLHALANERAQKNWDAAFRLWLGNAVKWSKQSTTKIVTPVIVKNDESYVTSMQDWLERNK